MKRRALLIGAATIALIVGGALIYLWIAFHSIPTQEDLRTALRQAETIELIAFVGGQPTRFTKVPSRESATVALAAKLLFGQRFWAFGSPPTDSLLVQTFVGDVRTGAFEVRTDDHLYVRKAVRWYRMPVGPDFRIAAQAILDRLGQPMPAEAKRDFIRRQTE